MNLLADLVLVAHALVALFIVGGFIAIWIGAWLHWKFIRNRMFRLLHLAAICFVALTSIIGVACPLTVLEDWLRTGVIGAGMIESEGFIQRWIGSLLYNDFPVWAFTLAYVALALMVIFTWRWIPPSPSN
jgi:uncharacterized membrane protein YfcA